MIEKLDVKINEELERVLEKKGLSLNEIRLIIDIRNSLELRNVLKEGMNLGFATSNIEKGE